MRLFPLLALAIACSPDHGMVPGDATGPLALDGERFLSDDVHDLPERARVRAHARASLVPGGEPLIDPDPLWPATHTLTVVEPGASPRVSWQDPRVQLLLFPDAEGFEDVAWSHTRTVGDPEDPTDAGATVPAGTVLEVLDTHAGHHLVTFDTLNLTVQSWVPEADVDLYWDASATPPPPEIQEGRLAMLLSEAIILDRPGGEPLAWPRFSDPRGVSYVLVTLLDDEQRGYVPVHAEDDGVEVLGWVHVDDLHEGSIQGRGVSRCGGVGLLHNRGTSDTNVPAETRLHAWPDGPVVGRTLLPTYVLGDPSVEWVALHVATPWGTATTWLTLW